MTHMNKCYTYVHVLTPHFTVFLFFFNLKTERTRRSVRIYQNLSKIKDYQYFLKLHNPNDMNTCTYTITCSSFHSVPLFFNLQTETILRTRRSARGDVIVSGKLWYSSKRTVVVMQRWLITWLLPPPVFAEVGYRVFKKLL